MRTTQGIAMPKSSFAIAAVASLACTAPAHAQFDGLLKRLENTAKAELEKKVREETKLNCLSVVAGADAAANCLEKELSSEIESNFGKMLRGEDIAVHQSSVLKTITTGEDTSWKNNDKNTAGSAKVVKEETSVSQQELSYSKSSVTATPPLEFIGEPFEATAGVNVRSGPGTEYDVVRNMERGAVTTVIGKVRGADWYMLGENGVAMGFGYAKNFAATESAPAPAASVSNDTDIAQASVEGETTCRTVEQSVTDKKGKTKTETITACKGANGWEII